MAEPYTCRAPVETAREANTSTYPWHPWVSQRVKEYGDTESEPRAPPLGRDAILEKEFAHVEAALGTRLAEDSVKGGLPNCQ